MRPWFIIVRHHTAFDYKWLRGSEGIICTKFKQIWVHRHIHSSDITCDFIFRSNEQTYTATYEQTYILHTPSPKMYWLLATHIDWSLIRTKLFTQFCYWTFLKLKSAAIPVSWSCEKFAKVDKTKRRQFPREITAHCHRWRTMGMLILHSFGSLLCFWGNFILTPLFGCWLMCFS